MTGEVTDWAAVLDAMQERLDRAECFLAGEDVDLDGFETPVPGGRLPTSMAGRAQTLLDATNRMEHRLSLAMGEVALRIEDTRAADVAWRRMTDRPVPSYIDRTA